MAIYHLSVKYVSRNQGRSSVGAAAYRAGDKLHNDYDGLTHDFSNKKGVIYTEIFLPQNAPDEFHDRQTLWNAVEQAEKRKDARTAREIEIALPLELSLNEQIELVRNYVQENLTGRGMCADVAIHNRHRHRKDERNIEAQNDKNISLNNPHAHILLTTRPVTAKGFSKNKDRDWESPKNVSKWRQQWAKIQNREFEKKGLDIRVSHESYAKQGIEKEPTIHLGQRATAMERRGIRTERGDENRAIIKRNNQRRKAGRVLETNMDQTERNKLLQKLDNDLSKGLISTTDWAKQRENLTRNLQREKSEREQKERSQDRDFSR
jgi:ATP-dependent exoDNAse (exonuclease V) alpha subunit